MAAKKKRNGSKYSAKVAAREPQPEPRATSAAEPKSHIRPADPSDTPDSEVRFVQASQSTKSYLCPGCNQTIRPHTGHMVVIPPDSPDLRRHWHRGCWLHRHSRG